MVTTLPRTARRRASTQSLRPARRAFSGAALRPELRRLLAHSFSAASARGVRTTSQYATAMAATTAAVA